MDHLEIVAELAGRDETVDGGTNGVASGPTEPVQLDGLADDFEWERGLDDRECKHGLASPTEGRLVAERLKNLLKHGETGDDGVEVHDRLEVEGLPSGEGSDPDGRVDEDRPRSRGAPAAIPRAVLTHRREVAFPES
jgi:hypothetical protein